MLDSAIFLTGSNVILSLGYTMWTVVERRYKYVPLPNFFPSTFVIQLSLTQVMCKQNPSLQLKMSKFAN